MNGIHPEILSEYGAVRHRYEKGSEIFKEGSLPRHLFFLLEGMVKVVIRTNRSKELIQGVFLPGELFGEPPFFIERPYPTTSIAVLPSVVLRISREQFNALLIQHPHIYPWLVQRLSERIYNKVLTTKMILNPSPEERVISFLNRLKGASPVPDRMEVPFTRQQIADFTGLRVETVIRAISKLNEQGRLEIIARKVYY